ncbi:MAG: hypothetical protein [Olavius algarvensis Gamma 1 endosymbiont]|nr:MAG: hypothetical protein [Olavius algarvensis Gamma 1 endosymbiont]
MPAHAEESGRGEVRTPSLRGCLGTHFRNSLKIGRLDKINPLF